MTTGLPTAYEGGKERLECDEIVAVIVISWDVGGACLTSSFEN